MQTADQFWKRYMTWTQAGGVPVVLEHGRTAREGRLIGVPNTSPRANPLSERSFTHIFGDLLDPWPEDNHDELIWLTIRLGDQHWDAYAHPYAKAPDGFTISFEDGSYLHSETFRQDPVDLGVRLLDPVEVQEYRNVEAILAELERAVEAATLTELQQIRLQGIVEYLGDQHRTTTPGETPRWQIVGPFRSGIHYLAKELPKDALAWWKLIELLNEAGWIETAGHFAHHLHL